MAFIIVHVNFLFWRNQAFWWKCLKFLRTTALENINPLTTIVPYHIETTQLILRIDISIYRYRYRSRNWYLHIGHPAEENQQQVSSFFKTNLFKQWMKKFVALLTEEKRIRMNGKMMTLTFFELYTVDIKN